MADSLSPSLVPPTIAAIIIAHNEAGMIVNCLDTLGWCDEVIVVDDNSSDTTRELAERWGARVVNGEGGFPELRNAGLAATKADWIVYIDADERVTPSLAREIKQAMSSDSISAYGISRRNILYGHQLTHGGWGDDVVVRLFRRSHLKKWAGDVHEHAEIEGETAVLKENLWHLTHRNVIEGLRKTIMWTPVEAQLLAEATSKPISPVTLVRKMVMEVVRRIILKQGYRDGTAGWVEALIQGANKLLVYAQVWEQQQQPSLPDRYQEVEKSIIASWQKSRQNDRV